MMVEDYPGIAILAMTHIPVGDNALRVTESMLALLKAGGASDQAAAYAADLFSMYVTAIAYEQSLYATRYSDPSHELHEVEKIARRFATLDAARFPTMAALAPVMTRGDGDERFELGMDVLINGLLATPTEGRLSPPLGPGLTAGGFLRPEVGQRGFDRARGIRQPAAAAAPEPARLELGQLVHERQHAAVRLGRLPQRNAASAAHEPAASGVAIAIAARPPGGFAPSERAKRRQRAARSSSRRRPPAVPTTSAAIG